MTFYNSITIIIAILMITMILHVFNYSGFKKRERLWYIMTFSCIMFCSIAEFLVHCGAYDPNFKIILTIITVLQFSLSPLLGILFTGALGFAMAAGGIFVAGFFIAYFVMLFIVGPYTMIMQSRVSGLLYNLH